MKKNIKKQPNKKKAASLKKKKNLSIKPKKTTIKKISKKAVVTKKIKKTTKSKTKAAVKKVATAVLRKKVIRKSRKQNNNILSFGNVHPQHGKFLLLAIAIIFACSVLVFQNMTKKEVETNIQQPQVAGVEIKRNALREREINEMVQGYPIAKMTRYIAKQDPKVAAFLVAIAKKESAWGDRKPVLNGEDCYNYWGFRLKSDRMGSGGHTCFDSPEEAVSIVGARLSHLVNEEKIDTAKEMVIWKCGYSCDGPEAAGSEKWIKDVDYYYKQMIN